MGDHEAAAPRQLLMESAAEVLRRRADSLAKEASEEEDSHRLSLLLFRIGEEWYAVGVSDVREIFQEYELTKLPGVPDYVLGVVNVRGEILSVTDPARIMKLGQVEMGSGVLPPAIVIGSAEVVTALVVDEIGDIADVPQESLEPPISIIDRAQAEFVAGSVHIGDSMVGIISTDRMLQPVITGGGRH